MPSGAIGLARGPIQDPEVIVGLGLELHHRLRLGFAQHRVPKLAAATGAPVRWPDNPALEGCPPGHADIYHALQTTGLLDRLLELGFDARGVEPDARLRGLCSAEGLPVAEGRAECIPFGDSLFDGVLFECSLSLASDKNAALREAFRVLVPGGSVLIQDLYRVGSDSHGGARANGGGLAVPKFTR